MDIQPARPASARPPLRARIGDLLLWGLFGMVATVAGLASAHLVAALTTPAASPVLAVGSAVIDRTPTPMKEWAIREFGSRDKVILIGSVLAMTLLLAFAAGILARRRTGLGVALLLVLVTLSAGAVLERPSAAVTDVFPAVVAGVVGTVVLVWCARQAHLSVRPSLPRAPVPAPGTSEPRAHTPGSDATEVKPAAPHPMLAATPGHEPTEPATAAPASASRRTLLLATGAITAVSAAAGWAGVKIEKARTKIATIVLPKPAEPAAPLPTGVEKTIRDVSALQTPTKDFYRVDVNLSIPLVPVDDWDLRIDGNVEHPFTLTFDELAALPLIERDITLTCVSNEVGGQYVGAARWLGVPLKALMDRAGVRAGSDQILSTAEDGFTISTPLEVALDGRDAMVAIGMNGEQLRAEHGFPARLVTPGLYGYVGATKWLRRLTVTTYAQESAYWTDRDWAIKGPIKISSRIDTPAPLARLRAGRVPIGGVAWAQHRGVGKVEVRIDDGDWQEARMGPDVGVDYWRQWYFLWDATPGPHGLAVRAVTLDGEVQTAERATPFPNGSSGIQELRVLVS